MYPITKAFRNKIPYKHLLVGNNSVLISDTRSVNRYFPTIFLGKDCNSYKISNKRLLLCPSIMKIVVYLRTN